MAVKIRVNVWNVRRQEKCGRCREVTGSGLRSSKYSILVLFTLLFCRRRLRNLQKIITHVHSHCDVLVAVDVLVCLKPNEQQKYEHTNERKANESPAEIKQRLRVQKTSVL